jgi:SAM-dependent methyltransferase
MNTSDGSLGHLAYFTEWGGKRWEYFVRKTVEYIGSAGRLDGLDVLEIGTRYGKLSLLFSILGANVTGIDISENAIAVAKQETTEWLSEHSAELPERTGDLRFLVYDGNLDVFSNRSFDVIFTKSVLVVAPQLEHFLLQINSKLKEEGRVAFIENARGNTLLHALRRIRHRKWDYRHARYFSRREADLVQSIFRIEQMRQTRLPPIYLFLGRKRR